MGVGDDGEEGSNARVIEGRSKDAIWFVSACVSVPVAWQWLAMCIVGTAEPSLTFSVERAPLVFLAHNKTSASMLASAHIAGMGSCTPLASAYQLTRGDASCHFSSGAPMPTRSAFASAADGPMVHMAVHRCYADCAGHKVKAEGGRVGLAGRQRRFCRPVALHEAAVTRRLGSDTTHITQAGRVGLTTHMSEGSGNVLTSSDGTIREVWGTTDPAAGWCNLQRGQM